MTDSGWFQPVSQVTDRWFLQEKHKECQLSYIFRNGEHQTGTIYTTDDLEPEYSVIVFLQA